MRCASQPSTTYTASTREAASAPITCSMNVWSAIGSSAFGKPMRRDCPAASTIAATRIASGLPAGLPPGEPSAAPAARTCACKLAYYIIGQGHAALHHGYPAPAAARRQSWRRASWPAGTPGEVRSMEQTIHLRVNGVERELTVRPRRLLV